MEVALIQRITQPKSAGVKAEVYNLIMIIFPVLTMKPPMTKTRTPLARTRTTQDSLYYCGLQAKIPPFVLARQGGEDKGNYHFIIPNVIYQISFHM